MSTITLASEGKRSYDSGTFRREAALAGTFSDLCRALGLVPRGANYATLRQCARDWDVDIGHLETAITRRQDISRPQLVEALHDAPSMAEALRRLGQKPAGSAYAWLRRQAATLEVTIDVPGQAWAAGTRRPRRVQIQDYLVTGPLRISSSKLRARLIESGLLPARCAACTLETWCDRPIPLELDHINGNRTDNRLENLRLLCPNCHAFTPTYRGRNIGRNG